MLGLRARIHTKVVTAEHMPKVYMDELNARIDLGRKELGKRSFAEAFSFLLS